MKGDQTNDGLFDPPKSFDSITVHHTILQILTHRLTSPHFIPNFFSTLSSSSSSSILPSVPPHLSTGDKTSISAFLSSTLFQYHLSKTFRPTHSLLIHQSLGSGGAQPLININHCSPVLPTLDHQTLQY